MAHYSNLNSLITSFKNGAGLKKLTSRGSFTRGVSLVIILFMVTTCKKEDEYEKFKHESPPVITVTQVENGLKISWNEVRGANNYDLKRSEDNFSGNTLYYSFPVYETFYIDENPLEGINYYRVDAIKCNRYDSSNDKECFRLRSDVVSFNYTPTNIE